MPESSMTDDLRVVFQSSNRQACADRALVLTSLQIPFEIVVDVSSCALVVPADYSARAMDQLIRYDEENPPYAPPVKNTIVYQDSGPGVLAYVIVVCVVAGLAARSMFGQDWIAAGRIDGVLVRSGELWRTITALTLHADLRHLAGNLLFGSLFGFFAGRLLGPGVAWLTIVLAGASGNALNTLLLESTHRAIGASTAVFAALGLIAGFVWRGKLMVQDRWAYRVGPIVGGFALLMYTGTGGPNTDIGAHLMGFVCGMAGGMLLSPLQSRLAGKRLQTNAAILTCMLIIVAWGLAFLA